VIIAVHVAQVAAGVDHIPHAALQLFRLGETALGLAVPEDVAPRLLLLGRRRRRHLHPEDAARGGLQRHLVQRRREGRQELLREVGGAEHPLALRAELDRDAREGRPPACRGSGGRRWRRHVFGKPRASLWVGVCVCVRHSRIWKLGTLELAYVDDAEFLGLSRFSSVDVGRALVESSGVLRPVG